MTIFAICSKYVANAASAEDHRYITSVLFDFLKHNKNRIAVDVDEQILLQEYAKSAENDSDGLIAKWLRILSKNPENHIEFISVKKSTFDPKNIVFELAKSTKLGRKIISWSSSDYEDFDCTGSSVNVFDRFDCLKYFEQENDIVNQQGDSQMSGNGMVFNINNQNVVNSEVGNDVVQGTKTQTNGSIADELGSLLKYFEDGKDIAGIKMVEVLSSELSQPKPRPSIVGQVWSGLMTVSPQVAVIAKSVAETVQAITSSGI
jgi:hypothetical protein